MERTTVTGEQRAGVPDAAAAGQRALHPRVVAVWTAQGFIATAIVVAVVLGGELSFHFTLGLPWPPGVAAGLAAVLCGVPSWLLPRADYRRWRYELGDEALELRHGVVTSVHSAIPYFRVQYIDLKQGPIERSLGLAHLVVHTAAAASDAEIPGIARDEAESLRRVLLARAGIGDAV